MFFLIIGYIVLGEVLGVIFLIDNVLIFERIKGDIIVIWSFVFFVIVVFEDLEFCIIIDKVDFCELFIFLFWEFFISENGFLL